MSVSLPAQQAPTVNPEPLRGDALAQHRPASRRPDEGGGRSRQPAVHLLYRHGERRRLEDHRRRPHVEADLRRPADRIDRLRSRSRRPIRTSSTSAAAKGCSGPTCRSATASTSRPTPARPGRISACATRSRSRRSPSIRRNPNRLFVAALGHPYGPNEERGIFRSTDGGQTFQNACCSRTRTPAARTSTSIPSNPDIVYATLWEQRQGPWENGAWDGTGGGIFKSTDGGTTWKPLTQGLPDGIDQRRSSAIAPSNPRRVYATRRSARQRHRHLPIGRRRRDLDAQHRPTRVRPAAINEAVPHVHPKDPDTLIVTDIVSYKSTDGGKTFVPFKGAPGGDDYQNIWINPNDPNIMLLVVDQGAVVTLNGGETWSSWYNQPTAALYHVMTDNAFPVSRLRRPAGQRLGLRREPRQRRPDHVPRLASGRRRGVRLRRARSARSRLVYGGKVTRYDRRTGQVSERRPVRAGAVRRGRPRRAGYRTVRTQPVVFSHGRSARAVLRQQRAVEDDRRRHQLEADQPGPDAQDVGRAEERRQVRVERATRERGAIGARVIYTIGAVVRGHQPHLGRHRRRRDPRPPPTAGCTGRTSRRRS